MKQKLLLFRKYGLIALTGMMMLSLGSASAFADDESGSTGSITVQITVGEHGTVNEHADDYAETVASGGNLTLHCAADEGFVISSVLVNEAELEAEDTEGLIGTGAGDLTLEGLTADLSVAVNFSDDTDGAGGATTGDSGEGTGDENGGGDAAGTDETGTDPEPGNETGGTTDEGSSGNEETGTDAGDTGSESPADSADQSGSGDGADDTGTASDDDSGDADGAADQTGGSTGTLPDGTDAAGAAGEDQTADTITDSETDAESDGIVTNDDSDSADGKGETAGKGNSGIDTYYSDSTPKTGDEFPSLVILLMLASLCAIGIAAIAQLLKRRSNVSA